MSAFALFTPPRLQRLIQSDAANVARDPLLPFALSMSAMPAIALWLWGDALDIAALDALGVADFSRYLAPIALLVPASLIGWVAGFLLLEDRDDNLLPALAVTPVGKTGFLAYRLLATAIATALVTAVALPVLAPDASWPTRAFLLFAVTAASVIYAIILPAIARNKVEGLALTKLTNLAAAIPLLALIPSPWRYLGGIIPTYWIGELTLAPTVYLPYPATVALAGAAYLAWGVVLFRRFAGQVG